MEKSLLGIIKPFSAQFDDELSVEVGNVVQFVRKIDRFWYEVYFEDKYGKIPIDSCREFRSDALRYLKIVPGSQQAIFIAKHDYVDHCEDKNLRFSRHEFIIGFNPIDNDWWNGTRLNSVQEISNTLTVKDHECGIFCLTYVWKLRTDLLPDFVFDTTGIRLKSSLTSNQALPEGESSVGSSDIANTGGNVNETTKEKYLFYVKVIKTMEAQLEDEIDLPEDDVLGIISIPDKLYYEGRSLTRNVKGIFPKNFVATIKYDDSNTCDNNENDDDDREQSPVPPSFSPPPPPPDVPDVKESWRIIEKENSNIIYENVNTYEPDDSPPSYEAAISGQPVALGYANDMFNEMEPYGRALYDFEAQGDSELSLRQNQIVRLIRYADQGWMEGEVNGKIGFFPQSHIAIIVDCKPTNGTENDTIQEEQNQVQAINYPPNTLARVLYDFDGEMERDLKIKAGDIITLLRRFTTTDWVEALDSSGHLGFVHLNFCTPICPSPVPETKPSQENVKKPEASLYPQIVPENSSQSKEEHVSPQTRPQRQAPNAPRNGTFPTFNQFLNQEKAEHYAFDLEDQNTPVQVPEKSGSGKNKNNQRECVIIELIQTEKDYCQALSICWKVFHDSAQEAERCNVDTDKLLANMKSIIDVSKRLIKLLENYVHNRPYVDQRVGICFLDLKFEIKESYTEYCRNHDSVHILLKKYENSPDSHDYMKKCLRKIQDQTNCFDLTAILIKPVQRILKYPLLLNELIKYTEENHVDYEPLRLAFEMITDIATCINEHKRRQDLIKKYCQPKDTTFAEKLKNLNRHTVEKKFSRFSHIIKRAIFATGTKDGNYEDALNKFQNTEKIIRNFIKDLKEYLDAMDKYHVQLLVVIDAIIDYCDLKRFPRFDIEKIREIHRRIYQEYFKNFKQTIESDVLNILNSLLERYNGPWRLIKKREDKRIDYEASLKSSKNDSNNMAKVTFDALNQELINELPLLSTFSLQILSNCIESFLCEDRKLIGIIAKFQLDLAELPIVKNSPFGCYQDIEDSFRVKHNLNSDQMLRQFSLLHASSFKDSVKTGNTWKRSIPISKTVQPEVSESSPMEKQFQQEPHRQMLMSKFEAQNLYMAKANFDSSDVLEISARRGDLLGVIKYKEPNGSDNRWYVDNGISKGLLPKSILAPYRPSINFSNNQSFSNISHQYDEVSEDVFQRYCNISEPLEPSRYYSVPDELSSDQGSLMSFEENKSSMELAEFDPLATISSDKVDSKLPGQKPSQAEIQNEIDDNNYTAAYPFKAVGPDQISLEFGQKVLVLQKHDAEGNTGWWLIKSPDGNRQGYVPGNYLKKSSDC